jgi:YfiR/HmsC-like
LRYRSAAIALLLLTHGASAASLEYAVKAAYLYKFVPFIGWPETSVAAANNPINICIFGKDPFGQIMDREAAGQRIGGRPIVIRHIPVVSTNSGCQVAYVGGSADQSVSQAMEILRAQPVLTVSDAAANPAERGIINLVVDDNRVRFEIDERAAEQSHLSISSKLLDLALQRQKPK